MPTYLYHGHYINEGVPGLIKDSGTGRETSIRSLIGAFGGKCHAVYYGLDTDAYAVAEMPDNLTAYQVALIWNKSGRLNVQTIPLLTPVEMDAVTNIKRHDYRAPGE